MVSIIIKIILVVVGAIACISGGVLYAMFPEIIKAKIEAQLILADGTTTYENWKNIPIPMYMKLYIFNVTNPSDFMNNNAKPIVEEIGPYTFKVTRKKEIIGRNEERDTVQYNEVNTYIFQPEISAGTQDEMVYVVNAPLQGIAKIATNNIPPLIRPFFLPLLSSLLIHYKEHVIVRRTVRQLLFDGYEVSLLKDLSKSASRFIKLPPLLLNNTFGLFYGKNATSGETFSVFTGKSNSSRFTLIDTWNNKTFLPYWSSKYCNMINGTATRALMAVSFHLTLKKEEILYVYSTDLCRSLKFKYEKEINIRGIKTYRFTIPAEFYADPTINPDNQCFCSNNQSCLNSGVIELTTCKRGAPVVASAPHFYQGSKQYLQNVIGLKPDKTRHQSFLDVEPMTGLVLNARKRIQLNIDVKRTPELESLRNISDVLIPLAWLSESATLDEENANLFKHQVQSPIKVGVNSTLVTTIVGALWTLIAGAVIFYFKKIKSTTVIVTKDHLCMPTKKHQEMQTGITNKTFEFSV
ncbi:platelet glycoprotein 4-like [Tachypleus tridentatus]|uniref:platelet glycoprotein 4-like n=1 Tax=Tachypleus tridentatus TaxID=6853 RepID=UPI003FD5F284